MVNCCVPFCTTNHKNVKKRGANFHEFPSDSELRQKWIRNIHRKDHTVSDRSYVCSLHFVKSDYVEGLKIRRLQKGAVPTEFPGYPEHLQARARNSKVLRVPEISRPPPEKSTLLRNEDANKLETEHNVSSKNITCSDTAVDVPEATKEVENQLRLISAIDHSNPKNIAEDNDTENLLLHPDEGNTLSDAIIEDLNDAVEAQEAEHQLLYLYCEEVSTNAIQEKGNLNCGVQAKEAENQLLYIYGEEVATNASEGKENLNNVVEAKEVENQLLCLYGEEAAANGPSPKENSSEAVERIKSDPSSPMKSGCKKLGRIPMSASMLRHSVRLYQYKTYKLKKQLEAATSQITELQQQLKNATSSPVIPTAQIVNDAQSGSTHALFLLDQLQAYGRIRARWSEETLRQCLLWQLKSSKGYRFARTRNLLKLPSRSTLKRYASAAVAQTDMTFQVELIDATKENQ